MHCLHLCASERLNQRENCSNLLVCNLGWKADIITSLSAWGFFFLSWVSGWAWWGRIRVKRVNFMSREQLLEGNCGKKNEGKWNTMSVSYFKNKKCKNDNFTFKCGAKACVFACMWLGGWGMCCHVVPSHVCSYVGFLTPSLVADGTVSQHSAQRAHRHNRPHGHSGTHKTADATCKLACALHFNVFP